MIMKRKKFSIDRLKSSKDKKRLGERSQRAEYILYLQMTRDTTVEMPEHKDGKIPLVPPGIVQNK